MRLVFRCVRWLAPGVLPVLLLLASAGTAAADCGDHVRILPKGAVATPEQPKPPCPCQGPACDRHPDAPAAPAPASSVPTAPPSDLLLTTADDPDPGRGRPFARDLSAVPVAGLTSIFHPPRA